ncbi:MAG: VRR-NUC domain-containing protein [Puniceicoccales bacterium]|nr:VRR-NUC domain-containing protein [Puniceicoccales bacterium]
MGAILNGHGQVGDATLRGYKSLRFRVGMPDIYWYLPRGRFHALFIELKTVKKLSRPTDEQVLMRHMGAMDL